MKKNLGIRVFSLVCVLVIIMCLFLPFFSYESTSSSLFNLNEELNYISYIFMGFSLISIVTILLNKKIELSYLLVGSSLTYCITNTIAFKDSISFFGYGYYLLGFTTILLFLSLIILNIGKKKEKNIIENNEVKKVNNNIEDDNNKINTNITNIEPNDLAKSIMDQPVMNNTIEEVNSLNNSNTENDLGGLNSNIENSLSNEENITLAPQNPLNSFLPSDFDPNQIVKEENNNVEPNINIEFTEDNNTVKEDNNQSIMSVMSQPMVNAEIENSNNIAVNTQNVNNTTEQVTFNQMNNQPVIEPNAIQPEINNQPVIEPNVMQPEINNQPVIEPNVMQPEINNQPVIEPNVMQPEINNQPVIEPNVMQPEINNQPVIEPNAIQPEMNNQPVIEPDIFNN